MSDNQTEGWVNVIRPSKQEKPANDTAGSELPRPSGSEIVCILTGADRAARTVTIQLPHGLTPDGLEIGQPFFVSYPFYSPNEQGEGRR